MPHPMSNADYRYVFTYHEQGDGYMSYGFMEESDLRAHLGWGVPDWRRVEIQKYDDATGEYVDVTGQYVSGGTETLCSGCGEPADYDDCEIDGATVRCGECVEEEERRDRLARPSEYR